MFSDNDIPCVWLLSVLNDDTRRQNIQLSDN